MARDDELATIRAAFDYQRSLVGNSGLTEESFKDVQKTARGLFQEVINTVSPWASKSVEDAHAAEMNNLLDSYRKYVGDPDDPEFQARLMKDRELLTGPEEEVVEVESEDKRIERLLSERDDHYARQRGMKP